MNATDARNRRAGENELTATVTRLERRVKMWATPLPKPPSHPTALLVIVSGQSTPVSRFLAFDLTCSAESCEV
jgi:hypothetical protein